MERGARQPRYALPKYWLHLLGISTPGSTQLSPRHPHLSWGRAKKTAGPGPGLPGQAPEREEAPRRDPPRQPARAPCLPPAPYPWRAGQTAAWRRGGRNWARRSAGELGRRRRRGRGIEGGRTRAESRGGPAAGWRSAGRRCRARRRPLPSPPPPPAPRTLSTPANPGLG